MSGKVGDMQERQHLSGAASSFQSQVAAAESALAKSASAAQAITKRAEQSARAMATQQKEMNRRQNVINSDGQKDNKGKVWHSWSDWQDRRKEWFSMKAGEKRKYESTRGR